MELPAVFDHLADRIRSLFAEKPIAAAVSAGLSFLALVAVIIVLIQTRPKRQPAPPSVPDFVADAPLFIPDAPVVEQDYYPSRVTGRVWSGEDVETWFTAPDAETLSALEDVNDTIISGITGAAP